MKTLKDVAGLYKTLAQTYMVNGPWRPAYKTGNLYRQVGDYNDAQQMIQQDNGIYKLVLDYAPPAAYYGRYVENGTYKMEARPFAQYAAQSDALKVAIDEFMQTQVKQTVEDLGSKLAVSLGKFGNSK
jgi:hypothetical protein